MQLSTGPWSYNRFNAYEQTLTEGAKPDFLDMDKDGDKKESMKKAIKDKDSKKKGCDDCGNEDCNCDDKKEVKEGLSGERYKKALEKGAMYSRKESEDPKKRGKVGGRGGRSDFGDGDRGGGHKNKGMQEQIIQSLIDDGLANNPVSAQIIAEHMSDEWAQSILDELN